ncbi:cystathionine beta-lyase [Ahniella affigens]|uniref:Cystathionine beta-lyase n=1 Tax=Ahniella affigens TaxID=2021234 RepID=A0A2P1PP15_9GAMM|nr:PLP-dependent aspartate aminotransferase family protein [Ahniella affigens]AVP96582.1 cystathionine beta-lyase [Ahniella affigens]
MSEPKDLSYILTHLGEDRAQYFDAVIPPIVQSAMFAHPNVATMRTRVADEFSSHVYTRGQNPTVEIVAKKIAALEGAEAALMFGSGAAAMAAAALSVLRAGDEVLCVDKPYAWTRTLVKSHLQRFGVNGRLLDARDPAEVEAAITDQTRLIILESPNSLTFEQQDLVAIARIARARGIFTLLDNSFATPLGQSAIELGIDLVAHSATKYLNGHSDVLAGVVAGSEKLIRDLFHGPYMTLGAILSPHDAWLLLRGLRTLPVRLKQIAETTDTVLRYLERHPKVARVHSPWAQSYSQFGLTQQQLRHGSGLLSIELKADRVEQVDQFVDRLDRFLIAASWGGYESLVFPVAGVRNWPSLDFPASVPVGLIRFSIGLESSDVLIADLEQAFQAI